MKTTTMLLLGAAGYLLYTKSKKAKAAAAAPASTKDSQSVAGALGAVMTGNPMLAELGSRGGGVNSDKLRDW